MWNKPRNKFEERQRPDDARNNRAASIYIYIYSQVLAVAIQVMTWWRKNKKKRNKGDHEGRGKRQEDDDEGRRFVHLGRRGRKEARNGMMKRVRVYIVVVVKLN